MQRFTGFDRSILSAGRTHAVGSRRLAKVQRRELYSAILINDSLPRRANPLITTTPWRHAPPSQQSREKRISTVMTMGRIRAHYYAVVTLMIFTGSSVLPTLSLPISAESAPAAGISPTTYLAVAAADHHQSSVSFDDASASPRLTDSERELSKHLHRNHGHEQHHVNSGQQQPQQPPPTPAQIHDSAAEDEATSGVEEQPQQQQQQLLLQEQKHQTEQQITDYSIYACDELPNLQQEDNSGDNGKTSFDRCGFAMNCNGGDGILFSHFFFCNNDYKSSVSTSTSSSYHSPLIITVLTLLLLLLSLLLLFRLLSSTTDEFFSPGLEMFSLRLGLPPRFAGVTLLALGNGAPDVAATMNAMLAGSRSVVTGGGGGEEEEEETGGREGYGMALGELTGTCMFNICLILGAIVIYLGGDGGSTDTRKNGDKKQRNDVAVVRGVPCQGPLLRDISVLILVCIVSMSYLKSGVIDHEFVYAMLGIYISYVLVVLGADAYHIFYHIPLLADALRRSSSCGSGFSLNGPMPSDDEKEEAGDGSIADEQTPLTALPSLQCDTSHRHLHHRNSSSLSLPPNHRHTIGETVIEAISNYSCAEESMLANHFINGGRAEHVQLIETAALSSLGKEPAMIQSEASIGWAPILDDGNEPLVVFHPNHAVHPHHHHHHQILRNPSNGPVLFLRSDSTGSSAATRRPTLCAGECKAAGAEETAAKATLSIDAPPLLTLTASQTHQIDSNRPNSWNEALSSNLQEFIEHWHDFFTDIYYNEEKNTWDIILLSIELPFTIARKVRSAVRSSLILTSLLLSHLCQI